MGDYRPLTKEQKNKILDQFDFACAASAIAKVDERAAKTPQQLRQSALLLLEDITGSVAVRRGYLQAIRIANCVVLSVSFCCQVHEIGVTP